MMIDLRGRKEDLLQAKKLVEKVNKEAREMQSQDLIKRSNSILFTINSKLEKEAFNVFSFLTAAPLVQEKTQEN